MKIRFSVLTLVLITFSLFNINCSEGGKSDQSKKQKMHEAGKLVTGWYHLSDGMTPFKRKLVNSKFSFYLDSVPIITAENFTKIEVNEVPNTSGKYYGLTVHLDQDGKDRWSDATGRWTGKRMGLIVDDSLIDVPLVNSEMDSGITTVNGVNQTKEDAESIMSTLQKEEQ